MRIPTPAFWYEDRPSALWQHALVPLGFLYGHAVKSRFGLYHPVPLSRPVLCVGNLVAGGAGKTPVVMSLVPLMQEAGFNPHILSRGYGGAEAGPLQVSPGRDTAEDVGDEALLLVDAAPCWIAKNRALGAQAAIDSGADLIIMDDGHQNPSLYKNFSLVVIDGTVGFGNGKIMPAGPLREDIVSGLARAHAAVVIGEDKKGVNEAIKKHANIPVFSARLAPAAENPDVAGKSVVAFAGIGRPEKFRETLAKAGAEIAGWKAFPDHFAYAETDLKDLLKTAEEKNATPVTTAKDHVRLPDNLKEKIIKFSVRLEWEDKKSVSGFIAEKVRQSP